MLLIECPWCGPRDEHEFRYGGETHIARPGPPEAVDDAEWTRYLFERGNPRGIHLERWHHGFGCQRWFNVARDTRSHRIHATYAMTDPPRAMPNGEDTP